MDFWIAVVSGGAAVLGAAVGGAASALPAFGAEKRASESTRRDELRRAILATLDAMAQTRTAVWADNPADIAAAGTKYIRASAELGTLLAKGETVITTYTESVMAVIIGGHEEAPSLLSQAATILPAWYRGSASLERVAAFLEGHPDVDELRARDKRG